MRLTAKAPQNELEWSILDVEQDEWERRLAELGVAAAANGFPVYPGAAQAIDKEDHAAPSIKHAAQRTPHSVRRVLPALAILVVLGGGLASYGAWRKAQAGIAHMEGDVANAVQVESLHANRKGRAPAVHESVQTVEFLDGAAQAAVLVTHTLGAGGIRVQPELRFYVPTAKGWQRSDPIAEFWGPTETLDTAHLHFVFGRRDRTVVEQAAPGAEALYATLRRATGQSLAGTGQSLAGTGQSLAGTGPLTIELAVDVFAPTVQPREGRIRMTSPALYPAAEQEQAAIFGRLLRLVLSQQLMAAAVQGMTVKPQWQPLLQGLGAWLAFTGDMPFPPDEEVAALQRLTLRLPRSAWRLDDLLGDILRYNPQTRSMQSTTSFMDPEQQRQREAAAEQLIDYIAGTYGTDALPKLLQGFAQYDDWEHLAPAVLGVSAAELEKGWHAAGREAAP